ncbi:MAG: LysR substrate-binding domain-containing protein [Rhodospirillaceae bacterium]|nr:LysR substrate-binding domain-containing protein [Rhodospirillaceae bacterium]
MNLKQLRYFEAIYETGSVSGASLRHNIAQSALSYQIANLEKELGVRLFERRPRGMAPTVEGDRLYEHVRRIFLAVDNARSDLLARSGTVAGTVTVGLPYTALEMIGLQLAERAAAAFPNLQLWIAESLSSQALSSLRRGSVDLALLYNPAVSADLRTTQLLTEEMLCIGRPEIVGTSGAPIDFDDVAKLPQLLLRHGDAARAIVDDPVLLRRIVRRSRIELISTNMLKQALVKGFGCAIGPRATLDSVLRDPSLHARRITRPVIRRRLCLAWLAEPPLGRAEMAVADLLTELIADAIGSGRWDAELET